MVHFSTCNLLPGRQNCCEDIRLWAESRMDRCRYPLHHRRHLWVPPGLVDFVFLGGRECIQKSPAKSTMPTSAFGKSGSTSFGSRFAAQRWFGHMARLWSGAVFFRGRFYNGRLVGGFCKLGHNWRILHWWSSTPPNPPCRNSYLRRGVIIFNQEKWSSSQIIVQWCCKTRTITHHRHETLPDTTVDGWNPAPPGMYETP